MDNRGFTLVELLAVMIILISISFVAVGGITASLERRDIKECKEQQELVVGAAKIYFSLNNTNSVTLSTLKGSNYFKDENKIDRLKDTDVISVSSNKNKYLYNGKEIGEASCD